MNLAWSVAVVVAGAQAAFLVFSNKSAKRRWLEGASAVLRGTQTKTIVAVLLVAAALCEAGVARAQSTSAPQKDVERVIRDFLVAFGNRDFTVFVPYFSEDATVFFPPSKAAPLGLVQGRPEIERTFKTIFDAYPLPPGRSPTPIAPQDLLIQERDGNAVVTFQLGGETARQRRTFVLKRIGDGWKIVHLHGSASGNQP